MDSAKLILELIKEKDGKIDLEPGRTQKFFLSGKQYWDTRVVTATGNIVYLVGTVNSISVQVNNKPWETSNLSDPNSLDKLLEALEVSLPLQENSCNPARDAKWRVLRKRIRPE